MRKRRAFTILELTVAGVILAAILMLSVRMLGALSAQARSAERRTWAAHTAASVLQRASLLEWDSLDSDAVAGLARSLDVAQTLPDGQLAIDVAAPPPEEDTPPAKQITVTITWTDQFGQPASPVRLTTWVYQHGRRTE